MEKFHITKGKPKAILIDVIDLQTPKEEAQKRLEELECLTTTYGGIVVVKTIQKRGLPDYATYIGKGKVDEIIEIAKEKSVEILVINNLLKPKQLFELNERFRKAKLKTEAWDRIDLILKIFSKHAKSTEAKLQIDLAKIHHMGPRIFNMGIELSQQSGAIGLRSGQGETNIELMKRHLRKQEQNILKKLEHYQLIREGHRKRRKRMYFKTAAIVGYTNAGKSLLLNSLTHKGAYVADQLFATLDTRIGKLYIQESHREVLISDTIGFIRDLPPELIQSFKSTLAETIDADLILHVIDINDLEIYKKIEVVEVILDQLGLKDKPKIYVFNKIDLVSKDEKKEKSDTEKSPEEKIGILKAGPQAADLLGWQKKEDPAKKKVNFKYLKIKYKLFTPVFVSAQEKTNLDELIEKIDKAL